MIIDPSVYHRVCFDHDEWNDLPTTERRLLEDSSRPCLMGRGLVVLYFDQSSWQKVRHFFKRTCGVRAAFQATV